MITQLIGEMYAGLPAHTRTAGMVVHFKLPSPTGLPFSLQASHTANEGSVRIEYKRLVPIYVFPEMKLLASLFPKQNYNLLSPNFRPIPGNV
jgi:hypothetical protein